MLIAAAPDGDEGDVGVGGDVRVHSETLAWEVTDMETRIYLGRVA